jgi:hypothetical protein
LSFAADPRAGEHGFLGWMGLRVECVPTPMRARSLVLLPLLLTIACKSAPPPPPPAPPPPPRPSAPAGPTRTDFATIAKKLVSRCVAGGWINEWRSKQPNIDAAKPKVHLRDFEDQTGQGLDPTYLNTTLEQKMRISGVYEMTADDEGSDFIGKGTLLRMAERAGGDRISVYTATLKLIEPSTNKVVYSCEATVQGEM